MGITVQLWPRTIAFSGSSTVRLKCGAISGRHPIDAGSAIALEGIGGVVQLYVKQGPIKRLNNRFIASLIRG
jgi:hypothetical protein